MESSIEIRDGVLIRQFKGEVVPRDVINSWEEIFANFENLYEFRGILTDLLEAEVFPGDETLDVLAGSLMCYRERIKSLRIAVVRDAPGIVAIAILLNSKLKLGQIKPFATREAALQWLSV